jgi:hypothetical protein
MTAQDKISCLQQLKDKIISLSNNEDFLYRIEGSNPWFIPEFTRKSLDSISAEMLDEKRLTTWITSYSISRTPKITGIIAAGNIPFVSFHDILCVYFTNHNLKLKLSSKDRYLPEHILNLWTEIDVEWKNRIEYVDRMVHCDKIIATGSNSTFNYFEHYFGKYDSILRKNRTSIGIVHKDIADEEVDLLMDDIFLYFGLGCRSISKLWIEKGFELKRIFEASERYHYLHMHSKYMNNYDYQRTLLLLNSIPHLSNDFLMLRESSEVFSPISVLHYNWFETPGEYEAEVLSRSEDIQCVIGRGYIPFGRSQSPSLTDYADGIDVMEFLMKDG